jgi:hypothetical protein
MQTDLKPKFVKIIFKNSVRTSKRTPHFTITKINWLMLFKELIAVYGENLKKPINTLYKQNAETIKEFALLRVLSKCQVCTQKHHPRNNQVLLKVKNLKTAHSLAVRYRHHIPLFSHFLLFFLWIKLCFIVLEVVKPIFPLVCLKR